MTASGTLPSSLQTKTRPARPQSGVSKKKKKTGGQQYKMPAKNRAYGNNDLDDMFGEGEIMGGDQGAPPGGSGDDFGEGDLL